MVSICEITLVVMLDVSIWPPKSPAAVVTPVVEVDDPPRRELSSFRSPESPDADDQT